MRKILLRSFGVLLLLMALFATYIFYVLWQHEVFVEPTYETEAPIVPDLGVGKKVLMFSKTNSFRHIDAIPAANDLFRDIALREGWGIYFTENGAIHNQGDLQTFDLIIWNNVTGNVLTKEQQAALKNYMETGGKFLGIHGTGGNREYEWAWHPAELIAAQFTAHPLSPQFQEANVIVEDRDHPATRHLPEIWRMLDEWYSFEESPRGRAHILATLDEESYQPNDWLAGDLRMGDDHPIIWHHRIKEGYVFYSAIGHMAENYSDENYRTLLHEAAKWLIAQGTPQ